MGLAGMASMLFLPLTNCCLLSRPSLYLPSRADQTWWYDNAAFVVIFFCICNYHVVTNQRKTNHINNKTKASWLQPSHRELERDGSFPTCFECFVGQNLSKYNEKDPLVFIFQVVSLNTTQSRTMMTMRASSPNLCGGK